MTWGGWFPIGLIPIGLGSIEIRSTCRQHWTGTVCDPIRLWILVIGLELRPKLPWEIDRGLRVRGVPWESRYPRRKLAT